QEHDGQQALRILIVDDNQDSAETLATLMRLYGFEADTATDGLMALKVAQIRRPQIILIDLAMPGMDGYQVADQLRAQMAPAPIVLAAVSGYVREADRKRSAEAGFERHFAKPVDLRELHSWLIQVADRVPR